MTKSDLSKKQIRFLKTRAHALNPVVRVGQHGLTDAVFKELDIALDHHELVKIKVAADDREARDELMSEIASRSKSVIVQSIGGVAVLFRQNPEKPVINLADAS